MKISDRLLQIKGSRPVSKWERETGIPRGTLDRAIKENKINSETATRLFRSENVRMEWLLSGKGAPYHIQKYSTDYEMAKEIKAYFEDEAERWTVTVVFINKSNIPKAIILTMPVQYMYEADDKEVNFINAEVLTGPFGLSSYKELFREGWSTLQQLRLDETLVSKFYQGLIGTYHLTNNPDYLNKAEILDNETIQDIKPLLLGELNSISKLSLTESEYQFLTAFRGLNQDDKKRLVAICAAFNSASK